MIWAGPRFSRQLLDFCASAIAEDRAAQPYRGRPRSVICKILDPSHLLLPGTPKREKKRDIVVQLYSKIGSDARKEHRALKRELWTNWGLKGGQERMDKGATSWSVTARIAPMVYEQCDFF